MNSPKTNMKHVVDELKRLKELQKYNICTTLNVEPKHYNNLLPFIIQITRVNEGYLFEIKDKKYFELLQYYLECQESDSNFFKYTMSSRKNIDNIFNHIMKYCICSAEQNIPLEQIKFIIVPEHTKFTDYKNVSNYLMYNSCGPFQYSNSNFIYFENKNTIVNNNMGNDIYISTEKYYYDKVIKMGYKGLEAFNMYKNIFQINSPNVYYSTLYSSFSINDLKIQIIDNDGNPSIVGLGIGLHYDLLKEVMVRLDNLPVYNYQDLFMLGKNHVYALNRHRMCIKCIKFSRKYNNSDKHLSKLLCDYLHEIDHKHLDKFDRN